MSANKKTRSLWGSRSEAVKIYNQRREIKRLEQENQQLKEELEKLKQPQIFIDTGDMEERYGEQLYQDYLKEQLNLYKSVIDEVIREINSATILNADNEHWLGKADVEYLLEILDKAKGE